VEEPEPSCEVEMEVYIRCWSVNLLVSHRRVESQTRPKFASRPHLEDNDQGLGLVSVSGLVSD
jgi:hypothetical protein